jgi:hypothetical protein
MVFMAVKIQVKVFSVVAPRIYVVGYTASNSLHHVQNGITRNLMTCTLLKILFRMIKSRRIRWAGHITRIGEMKNKGFWSKKGRDHSEDLGVDGRIIL